MQIKEDDNPYCSETMPEKCDSSYLPDGGRCQLARISVAHIKKLQSEEREDDAEEIMWLCRQALKMLLVPITKAQRLMDMVASGVSASIFQKGWGKCSMINALYFIDCS